MNSAIELEPTYARAYARRGLIYLWLGDINLAKADYIRSWELNAALIKSAWMAEWCETCQRGIDPEMAERLGAIAAINQHHYITYVCQGVESWQRGEYTTAMIKLKQALELEPENWDTYFWMGMVYFSLNQGEQAMASLEKSLEIGLPPVLLAALTWLKQVMPEFYEKYVVTLLDRY